MIDVIKIIFSFAKIYIFYSYLYIFFVEISKKRSIITITILSILNYFLNSNIDNNNINIIISLVTFIIVTVLLFKHEKIFTKKWIILGMYFFVCMIIEIVISIIALIVIGKETMKDYSTLNLLLLIYYIILFLILNIIRKAINKHYTLQGKLFVYMFQAMIPFLSIIFIAVFIDYNLRYEILYTGVEILVIVIFLLINAISFLTFTIIERLYIEKHEVEISKIKFLLKEQHFQEIELQNKETRRIKHNIKNQLAVASEHIKMGDINEAIEIISSLIKETNENEHKNYTSNKLVNTIVNIKFNEMQHNFIKTNININIPRILNVEDRDLIDILCNAFDNAIEAAKECAVSERYVKFTMIYYSYTLIIKIENNVKAEVKNLDTKKENSKEHGIGTKTIEEGVKKYDGVIEWKSTSNKFEISMILCDAKYKGDLSRGKNVKVKRKEIIN